MKSHTLIVHRGAYRQILRGKKKYVFLDVKHVKEGDVLRIVECKVSGKFTGREMTRLILHVRAALDANLVWVLPAKDMEMMIEVETFRLSSKIAGAICKGNPYLEIISGMMIAPGISETVRH